MGVRTIAAGTLDQLVTLQQRSAGVDERGQEATTWSTVADVWARVEPLRGREFFAAGQVQVDVTMRVTIRWRANVDPTWRLVWRGDPYDIVAAIDVDGARQMLELMCSLGGRDTR